MSTPTLVKFDPKQKKVPTSSEQISKEISRLIRKLNEALDNKQYYNALFSLALLNVCIQKKLGAIRFEEREKLVNKK